MINALFDIAIILLTVLWYVIVAQVILSWLVAFNVINTQSNFVRTVLDALDRLTAPLYRPIRKILPDFGGIDLSPIVILLANSLLIRLIAGAKEDYTRTLM